MLRFYWNGPWYYRNQGSPFYCIVAALGVSPWKQAIRTQPKWHRNPTSCSSFVMIWGSMTCTVMGGRTIIRRIWTGWRNRGCDLLRRTAPTYLFSVSGCDSHRKDPGAIAPDDVPARAARLRSQKVLHPEIQMQVPLEEEMLPKYFQRAGYVCGTFGKWHVGGKGFARWSMALTHIMPAWRTPRPPPSKAARESTTSTAAAEKFIEANRNRPSWSIWPTIHRTFPTMHNDSASKRTRTPSSPFTPP